MGFLFLEVAEISSFLLRHVRGRYHGWNTESGPMGTIKQVLQWSEPIPGRFTLGRSNPSLQEWRNLVPLHGGT